MEKFWGTNRWIRIAVSAMLLLAVLAAALPQQAQAASCRIYYTVEKGDKKGTIAREYDVKWIEIAKANDLSSDYVPAVGDVLCIPYPYSVTLKYNLTVKSVDNLVRITASDFPDKGNYYVRARDITTSPGAWYKLGKMKIEKGETNITDFVLPKGLRSAIYLQVCIKHPTTDKATCKLVRHQFSQPQQ